MSKSNVGRMFTSENIIEAYNNGQKVLNITKKSAAAESTKKATTTKYLNVSLNVGPYLHCDGWLELRDVELSIGVVDPNNLNDKRNLYDSTRCYLQTSKSISGNLCTALQLIDNDYIKQISVPALGGSLSNKRLHRFVQTHLSDDNPSNPGGEIEDPIVRMKFELAKSYPANMPNEMARGCPKTTIFDFTKPYVDNGILKYKVATVVNDNGVEEPININNFHKFATKGSIIRHGRFLIGSVSITGSWASLIGIVFTAVIEPATPPCFSDEIIIKDVDNLSSVINNVNLNSNTDNTVNTANTTTTTTSSDLGDLEDFL